ncbi:MAG: IS481 family transposase [Microbacteriaceae bacterium]|nr:MAG: IS481 family transposase [Microbacteriaceae bacterium]
MSHANARLTVHGRRLIIRRRSAGWAQAHIAAAMGCSRKTVRYWIARFDAEGEAGLADRSTRPLTSPARVPVEVEAEAVRLRQSERLSRDELAERVGVSPRTASRIIARNGLPPLSALDPMTGEVIRSSKQTTIRYQRERPGELVHMDVKKLGRIPDGGGWKALGRGAGDNRDRKHGTGYDYVHSLVDDCTRLAYSEILDDEKGTTCAGFLARALDYFASHGITRVERLMTDNAWAYKWSLRDICKARGDIKQVFIKPHCPWQNGKVERFNRTLQTEWAYRRPFASNDERTAALDPWLQHYNTERRHSALGGQPPLSLLAPKS